MWANGRSLRAQDQYCGLRCNECGLDARARINDCGPERMFYCEPSIQLVRAATRTQLSRGESRQDVAQRIFFADQGMFRSGDYYQMMNRASCLSLLSNAVLVYNTSRIARILEHATAQGQEFTPEAIAHVSPLAYRHVIVNGTYDFSPPQANDVEEKLCL
jgi:Tn3 transposase DDE domain